MKITSGCSSFKRMMLSNYQSPFIQKVIIYYNKIEGLKERLPLFLIILLPFSVISLELDLQKQISSALFQFPFSK